MIGAAPVITLRRLCLRTDAAAQAILVLGLTFLPLIVRLRIIRFPGEKFGFPSWTENYEFYFWYKAAALILLAAFALPFCVHLTVKKKVLNLRRS